MSLTTSPALLAELVTVRCFQLKSIRSWLLPLLLSLLLFAPASQAADDTLTTLLKGGKQAEITQLLDGKVISTDITAQDDQKIQKRLEQLYKDIDGFRALKVTVKKLDCHSIR